MIQDALQNYGDDGSVVKGMVGDKERWLPPLPATRSFPNLQVSPPPFPKDVVAWAASNAVFFQRKLNQYTPLKNAGGVANFALQDAGVNEYWVCVHTFRHTCMLIRVEVVEGGDMEVRLCSPVECKSSIAVLAPKHPICVDKDQKIDVSFLPIKWISFSGMAQILEYLPDHAGLGADEAIADGLDPTADVEAIAIDKPAMDLHHLHYVLDKKIPVNLNKKKVDASEAPVPCEMLLADEDDQAPALEDVLDEGLGDDPLEPEDIKEEDFLTY